MGIGTQEIRLWGVCSGRELNEISENGVILRSSITWNKKISHESIRKILAKTPSNSG